MNKIEADNFAYDILVAKAKDINETVVEEINQKREKAENAFAEAKKKYEADIAELESKLTTLRNIHRKYEDNLAEVIKDDIAQVESKFNVHIDHINAELKQHENTLNRNNEKVKAEVADLLKKISTNEFNSSVELRRRIGYDRVDELGRQYAINPATNKALAVDSINRPRRGFSQKFYNDL
jgi:DNA repair ATPase RecN